MCMSRDITLQSSAGHPMSTSHHFPSHCGMSKKGCIDSPHSWGKQVHVSSPYPNPDCPCHSLNGGFPTRPAVSASTTHRATGELLRPFAITDPNTAELLRCHTYATTSYTVQKANCTESSSIHCLACSQSTERQPDHQSLANKPAQRLPPQHICNSHSRSLQSLNPG